MAAADDDLDFNPFYQALQSHLHTTYKLAQEKCYLILIPSRQSIEGFTLDARFSEVHILKPSPYFKGQFITTDLENSGTIYLEDGNLTTASGFPDRRSVKILSEESGYNHDMKPYQILIIDRPLIRNPAPQVAVQKKTLINGINPFNAKSTLEECSQFLNSFEECQQCLVSLQSKVKQFQDGYLMIQGYLDDAASRLQQICEQYSQMFIEKMSPDLSDDGRVICNVHRAIESHTISLVFDKIWPVVCTEHDTADRHVERQLSEISVVEGQVLGLHPDFNCAMTAAVIELANLNGLKTPLEKLMCMKTTLDAITETVNSHLQSRQTNSDEDLPCLTSDDYIPLLVMVLSQCSPPHLVSNMFFVEHFHWSSRSSDNISYSLVTFKASIQYITSLDVKQLVASHSLSRKPEASHDDLATSKQQEVMARDTQAPIRRTSRLERQMNRITKMMETTALEIEEGNKLSLPPAKPVSTTDWRGIEPTRRKRGGQSGNSTSQLGEFLSALKDDSLPSFGKQK